MSTCSRTTRLSAVGAAFLAAAAGLGVSALGAALLGVPSPVMAVGNHAIDLAPGPLKDYAIRTFGENDKPILVGSVLVVLVLLAVVAGLVALRRRVLALAITGLIGVVAVVSGFTDRSTSISPVVAALPGVLALAVSVGSFAWMLAALAKRAGRSTPGPLDPHPGDDLRSDFDRLAFLAAAVATGAVAGGGGIGSQVFASDAAAASRDQIAIPKPTSAAPAVPAGVQSPVAGWRRRRCDHPTDAGGISLPDPSRGTGPPHPGAGVTPSAASRESVPGGRAASLTERTTRPSSRGAPAPNACSSRPTMR